MTSIVLFDMPFDYGGARREAADTCLLWRSLGINVTILPEAEVPIDNPWIPKLLGAGCHIMPPCEYAAPPAWLRDKTVVAFQSSKCVRLWPQMKPAGCKLIYLPCMAMLSPQEQVTFPRCPPTAAVFQSYFQFAEIASVYTQWGVPPSMMVRILGAFDMNAFPFRPKPHKPGEPFIVGSIGRDVPAKWPNHLLEILASARKDVPEIEAHWLGWTPLVEKFSGTPPTWVKVFPPGSVSTQDFLAGCHCLLVAPDCSENWSRVVLEAMSSGVPVVATNAGGLVEQLDYAMSGCLCDVQDDYVTAIHDLAADEQYRRRLAAEAYGVLTCHLADQRETGRQWLRLFAAVEKSA